MKTKDGITLIALIITIIVMLILVGVTVTVAINGKLFESARKAATGTVIERNKEVAVSGEEVEIDGIIYASMNDYVNNNPKLPSNATKLSEKEAKEEGKVTEDWDLNKVTAVEILEEDGTTKNVIPLPKGFQISLKEGENTVAGGLVIKDGANEFVWIPCTEPYTEDSFGPLTDIDSKSNEIYDSQKQLDYYYGDNNYNYEQDFNYVQDKENIEISINKYKGFYAGRYETTIDNDGTIGSKKGVTVLTAETIIKKEINQKNNKPYYYMWYGLYKAQKDVYAENNNVFSTMITSKEWDQIMKFTQYGSTTRGEDTYTTDPDLSGSSYKGTTNIYDISKNIYDLAGNVCEWTMKVGKYSNIDVRVTRGGYKSGRAKDGASGTSYATPTNKSGAIRL